MSTQDPAPHKPSKRATGHHGGLRMQPQVSALMDGRLPFQLTLFSQFLPFSDIHSKMTGVAKEAELSSVVNAGSSQAWAPPKHGEAISPFQLKPALLFAGSFPAPA